MSQSFSAQSFCENCEKPLLLCMCDRLHAFDVKTEVLILQHPQEQDRDLGSARLAALSLNQATLRIGLSWPSLAAALGRPADPKEWAVLYLGALKRELDAEEKAQRALVLDRQGQRRTAKGIRGLLILDGSWSQAKALWWRNAWMLKLNRLLLHPPKPSLYGKLRKEPRRECLSTIEAIGESLTALGEPPTVQSSLESLFRTLLQRARDLKEKARAPAAHKAR